jgi:molecular chaperone GrpE
MTQEERNKIEEEDIIEEMKQEVEEIENEDGEVDEEKVEEALHPEEEITPEDEKCRDVLARTMADFDNFKKRTERDKTDMIFFLKQDIFKKILPRLDDLDRIIKNTPDELQANALFE